MIPSRGISRCPLHIAANRRLPASFNRLPGKGAVQGSPDVLTSDRGRSSLAGRPGVVKLTMIRQLQVLVKHLQHNY